MGGAGLGTYCLGGTLTSRLDRVLREEKGYTYGVRAFAQVLLGSADGTGAALLAHQRLGGHRGHRPGAGRHLAGASGRWPRAA